MMNGKPKKWDVWWAFVKYEDSNEVKRRPVVIYNTNCAIVVAFKITSTPPRPYCKGECALRYWKEANLSKESTVRVSKYFQITEKALDVKIGEIHPSDILLIQHAMLQL